MLREVRVTCEIRPHAPGLTGLAGLGAVAKAEDSFLILGNNGISVAQEPVKSGMVPGIVFDSYVFIATQPIKNGTLEQVFRLEFAKLGYQIDPPKVQVSPVQMAWQNWTDPVAGETLVRPTWVAVVYKGPAAMVGRKFTTIYEPPTAQDAEGLPVAVQRYTTILRPRDGVVNKQSVEALVQATLSAHRELFMEAHDCEPVTKITATGVPGTGNWGLFLMLGAGAVAAAFMGKKKGG